MKRPRITAILEGPKELGTNTVGGAPQNSYSIMGPPKTILIVKAPRLHFWSC